MLALPPLQPPASTRCRTYVHMPVKVLESSQLLQSASRGVKERAAFIHCRLHPELQDAATKDVQSVIKAQTDTHLRMTASQP